MTASEPDNSAASRKERERRFRMDFVLDAAWEVFAEQSYDRATVEDIARAAEISVGTLYQLFRSKEDVYRSLVARQQSRFFEYVNDRVDQVDSPRDWIHTAIAAHMQMFAEFRSGWRMYVTASSGFSPELRDELFREVLDTHQTFLRRTIDVCYRGLEEGAFRPGLPPELLAVAILSVPHSFLAFIFENDEVDVSTLTPRAIEAVDRLLGC